MGNLSFPLSFAAPDQLPAYTFAQMKALTGMRDGQLVRVSNYGRGGSTWRYSVTLTDWFPVAPCKVYENTAQIDGANQTADQLLVAIPLEAGLLSGKVFRLIASMGKSGTTDAAGTTNLRLGTAGTTADTSIQNATTFLNTATNRSVGLDVWFRMASDTSVVRLGGYQYGSFTGVATAALLAAATAVSSVASNAMKLSITQAMAGTTDKPQLGYVAVEIQP